MPTPINFYPKIGLFNRGYFTKELTQFDIMNQIYRYNMIILTYISGLMTALLAGYHFFSPYVLIESTPYYWISMMSLTDTISKIR